MCDKIWIFEKTEGHETAFISYNKTKGGAIKASLDYRGKELKKNEEYIFWLESKLLAELNLKPKETWSLADNARAKQLASQILTVKDYANKYQDDSCDQWGDDFTSYSIYSVKVAE